jgi:hypothetical protein
MSNANTETDVINIQYRDAKFRYWRKSAAGPGDWVSTFLGILNPTFMVGTRYPKSRFLIMSLPGDFVGDLGEPSARTSLRVIAALAKEAPIVFF